MADNSNLLSLAAETKKKQIRESLLEGGDCSDTKAISESSFKNVTPTFGSILKLWFPLWASSCVLLFNELINLVVVGHLNDSL